MRLRSLRTAPQSAARSVGSLPTMKKSTSSGAGGEELHLAVLPDALEKSQVASDGVDGDGYTPCQAVSVGIVELGLEPGAFSLESIDDLAHRRSWDLNLLTALTECLQPWRDPDQGHAASFPH